MSCGHIPWHAAGIVVDTRHACCGRFVDANKASHRGALSCCVAATLLGVDKNALAHALTTRSRVMREGVIVSPLNVRAAVDNR